MPTINLSSSNNQDALVNAIKQAPDTNATLALMTEPHYTKPGYSFFYKNSGSFS